MEEKQRHILEKVSRLYFRYGIRSVTMDDVSRELGISKKTLYEYFSDKEELVDKAIDYLLQNPHFDLSYSAYESLNSIDKILAIREHVNTMMKTYNNRFDYDLKRSYPAIYSKIRDFKRKSIFEQTYQNLEEGKVQGLYRDDLNSELVAKLHTGRVLLVMNPDHDIFTDEMIMSKKFFDSIMDYHFHAICTRKGLNYYKKRLHDVQDKETI